MASSFQTVSVLFKRTRIRVFPQFWYFRVTLSIKGTLTGETNCHYQPRNISLTKMGSYHIILLFRELLNFSSDNADLGAEFVYSRGKEGGGVWEGIRSVLPSGFVVF